MISDPTYRLAEFARAVGITPRRCQFWVKEGLVKPIEGGGRRGRHWQFTQDEVRIAQLILALHEGGFALRFIASLAISFREAYLPRVSPRLETGARLEDVPPVHKRWRQRTKAALGGTSVFLVIGHPIAEGQLSDPAAAFQIDLRTPAELGKKLPSKQLGSRRVVTLINLAEVWAS